MLLVCEKEFFAGLKLENGKITFVFEPKSGSWKNSGDKNSSIS